MVTFVPTNSEDFQFNYSDKKNIEKDFKSKLKIKPLFNTKVDKERIKRTKLRGRKK